MAITAPLEATSVHEERRALGHDGRGHVDDAPRALCLHDGRHRAAAEPPALDVHGHEAVPLRLVDLLEGGGGEAREERRVVDEDVDAPETLHRLRDHGLHGGDGGDVGADRVHPALVPELPQGGRRVDDVGDDHARPFGEEAPRVGEAEPGGPTRDDGDLVQQSHARSILPRHSAVSAPPSPVLALA
jgi:hypothetical protein